MPKKLDPRIKCLCGKCKKCIHRERVRGYRRRDNRENSAMRTIHMFSEEVASIEKLLYKPPVTNRRIPYAD